MQLDFLINLDKFPMVRDSFSPGTTIDSFHNVDGYLRVFFQNDI